LRIGDGFAQHLVTTANAEHPAPGTDLRLDIDVPAFRLERRQVGPRRLAARQDDQIGSFGNRRARLNDHDIDARFGAERIEIVEVGDTRQARHGDDVAAGAGSARNVQGQHVLGGQFCGIGEVRDRPKARPPGAFGDEAAAVFEQCRITLKAVDEGGNDLSRINNEIEKLLVNLAGRKNITEDDIERYVGVSKEYNVFELQDAFAKKDRVKAIRIIQYFESNPKAGPIQLILPSIYNFFSKAYMIFGQQARDEKSVATAIGVNPYFVKDYLAAVRNYNYEGIENGLLLLHAYNLKSIGVGSAGTEDASLLKELVVKMMA